MSFFELSHPFHVLIVPDAHVHPTGFEPFGFRQLSRQKPALQSYPADTDTFRNSFGREVRHKYDIVYDIFGET